MLLVFILSLGCRTPKLEFPEESIEEEVIVDADGDGYLYSEDCDDENPQIYPGNVEICDGVDNNCNNEVDEGVLNTYYLDEDEDGFGDETQTIERCEPPLGYGPIGGDCDDLNNTVYPGAVELCDNLDNDCNELIDEGLTETYFADSDGDGFGDAAYPIESCGAPQGYVSNDTDCDDESDTINPSAEEYCNGIDDDCDGVIDNGTTITVYYADNDNDGYGDPNNSITDCVQPQGTVTNGDDCDDADSFVNPSITEICNGIDDDCNGTVDDGAGNIQTFYPDNDGDGYGSGNPVQECSQPTGYAGNNTDCDDSNASINPGEPEYCNGIDDNCDGQIDNGVTYLNFYADTDNDGYGDPNDFINDCTQPPNTSTDNTDCDDTDPAINPGEAELCNGIDDNCSGIADDGLTFIDYYDDIDGDGYGDPATFTNACVQPPNTSINDSDCDDSNFNINPGQDEICNNIDDDCDGSIDIGAIDALSYYPDNDGDTYGAGTPVVTCTQPSNHVTDNTDCDDTDDSINPGETESCNGIDDDCNGTVDDGFPLTTYYSDNDGDGYGDPNQSIDSCFEPPSTSTDNTDCDDGNFYTNPGRDEVCNGSDDNCDGQIDNNAVNAQTFYLDYDGDGYGDATTSISECTAPPGYVSDDTDCDDSTILIHPGLVEICNGIDDDCSGAIDDGLAFTDYYLDDDGDGYGDPNVSVSACAQPSAHVTDNTDCDDTTVLINPGETEVCNGTDDDCDGTIDVNAADALSYYADSDGDGFGAGGAIIECSQPPNTTTNDTDCDDSNSSIYPSASELCNGIDDDCDGTIDNGLVLSTFYTDNDGDGYGDFTQPIDACAEPLGASSDSTDCDDGDATVNPSATEVCNETDDNCDGQIDEGLLFTAYYDDLDGDGYGDPASSTSACTQPSATSSDNTDCDDGNANINPAVSELCNGYDDNCDGVIDDDAIDGLTFYLDSDGDGYGSGTSTTDCELPQGYSTQSNDCDDGDYDVNPGASETCDGLDNDCDGTIDANGVCPCNTENYNGHAYLFCTTVSNYYQASSYCQSQGNYELIEVNDWSEQSWMHSTAYSYSSSNWWWIGYHNMNAPSWQEPSGGFEWLNGGNSGFTRWDSGQPDDWQDNEDCVHIYPDGYWNDLNCSSNNWYGTTIYFICESN